MNGVHKTLVLKPQSMLDSIAREPSIIKRQVLPLAKRIARIESSMTDIAGIKAGFIFSMA